MTTADPQLCRNLIVVLVLIGVAAWLNEHVRQRGAP